MVFFSAVFFFLMVTICSLQRTCEEIILVDFGGKIYFQGFTTWVSERTGDRAALPTQAEDWRQAGRLPAAGR
jgi:hypothetical protein